MSTATEAYPMLTESVYQSWNSELPDDIARNNWFEFVLRTGMEVDIYDPEFLDMSDLKPVHVFADGNDGDLVMVATFYRDHVEEVEGNLKNLSDIDKVGVRAAGSFEWNIYTSPKGGIPVLSNMREYTAVIWLSKKPQLNEFAKAAFKENRDYEDDPRFPRYGEMTAARVHQFISSGSVSQNKTAVEFMKKLWDEQKIQPE